MKYKKAVFSIIAVLLCVADWYFSNVETIINARASGLFSERDILLSLLSGTSDYNGVSELLVVYTVPVLLGIWYLTESEKPAFVLRFEQRGRYKRKVLENVLLGSAVFSAIHELVQVVFMYYWMEREVIEKTQFLLYSFLTFVVYTILYVQTGLLWHLFTDVLRSRLEGLLAVFGINFLQYQITKYTSLWLPGRDCVVAFYYITGTYTTEEFLLVVAKEIFVLIALYAICLIIFEKKDLMRDEKK